MTRQVQNVYELLSLVKSIAFGVSILFAPIQFPQQITSSSQPWRPGPGPFVRIRAPRHY